LLEPELLAPEVVVVGIEDPGDVLGEVLLEDGLDVVAVVEEPEVEVAGGHRRPKPQGVDHVVAEAGDGVVVGHRKDGLEGQTQQNTRTNLQPSIECNAGNVLALTK